MRPQTLLVLVVALGCGLAAAVGVRSMGKSSAPPVETVSAVVAAVDVRRGEELTESMIEIRQIPKNQAPDGLIPTVEEAVSRTADFPFLKGEFIVEPKLFPKGSGAGLAAMVPPGMRAFTIQTPSFSSTLAGLIRPRDRVDVLLTMEQESDQGGTTTSTLLQQIELLAVHTTIDAPSSDKVKPNETRSVTLLVTPKEAAILDLGQNKGTLHLSLRNIKDEADHETPPVTMADLGLPRPEPAPAPEPEMLAAVDEPAPVTMPIRTMRGTSVGYDMITIHRPARALASKPPIKSKRAPEAKAAGPMVATNRVK